MPDISEIPTEDRAPGIRFCGIDVSSLPDRPMFREWISFATYFRWVLPEALQADYETLLYLDTDTYLRRTGIDQLFASLTRPLPLAGVIDFQKYIVFEEKAVAFFDARLRDMGGPNGEYYNAGVLLIQPGPFAAIDGFARLLEAIQRNEDLDPIYEEQDQGALNLAFAGVMEKINPLYNWCSRDFRNDHMVELFDPIILHFAGPNKPWNVQDDPYIRQFHQEYVDFLTRADQGFEPAITPNSAASRYAEARHSLPFLNELRVRLYLRRWHKKLSRAYSNREIKVERMRGAIDDATLGK